MSISESNNQNLIDAYFDANTESASSAALENVRATIHVLLINSLRAKFKVSMRNGDGRAQNQDALEIAADAELQILQKLRRCRHEGANSIVENLEAYVRQVARNKFNQYLRTRHPVRASLKNQIRYVFTRKPGLRIDKSEAGIWLCGFADQFDDLSDVERPDELIRQELEQIRSSAAEMSLPSIVNAVLEISGRPLPLEQLVSVVFETKGLREPIEIEESASSKLASPSDHGRQIELREFLEKLWVEVLRLPLLHRQVLLLNLTNREGDSLIAELPLLRIASIRSIAEALEISAEEFAKLWPALPIDDNQIATRLSLSRQQVINLRHSARATLKRRIKW